MNLVIKLIVNTLAVLITAWLLGDGVFLSGISSALLVAFILAVFNITLKPLMILLTLPISVVTFGLFLFVINALLIMGVDSLVGGFEVANFWWALLFSLVLSLINSLMMRLGQKKIA